MRRRALVTGGSGGIGAAICKRLARDGHIVYVHANRSIEAAADVVAEITAAGGEAQTVSFDVTNAEATRAALEAILNDGAIQILVNNAGIHDDAVFPGMSAGQWHTVINTSVDGFFNVTQPLMMPMIRTRWGRIVNISSVHGVRASEFKVAYVAAKHALEGLSKVVALEGAPHGVTSNCVNPAYVRTPLVDKQIAAQAQRHGIAPDEVIERIMLAPAALKRLIEPDEVAAAVSYLCSPPASFITGSSLMIDGGWSIQ